MASYGSSFTRLINGIVVEPGAMITTRSSSNPVLGRIIEAGGRCESLNPECWTAILTANGVLWEGQQYPSHGAARHAAEQHARAALDSAVEALFRD